MLQLIGGLDWKRNVAHWIAQTIGDFGQCSIPLWAAFYERMNGICDKGGCNMMFLVTLCLTEPSPSMETSMPRYLSQSLDGCVHFPWIIRGMHMRLYPCCFNGMECLQRWLLTVWSSRLWAILNVRLQSLDVTWGRRNRNPCDKLLQRKESMN